MDQSHVPLPIWSGASDATKSLKKPRNIYEHDFVPDYGGVGFGVTSNGRFFYSKSYGSDLNPLTRRGPVALFSIGAIDNNECNIESRSNLLGYSTLHQTLLKRSSKKCLHLTRLQCNSKSPYKNPFLLDIENSRSFSLSHDIDDIHVVEEKALLRSGNQITLLNLSSDMSLVSTSELNLTSITAKEIERPPHLLSLNPSSHLPEIIYKESSNLNLCNYETGQVVWSTSTSASDKRNNCKNRTEVKDNCLYICKGHPRLAVLGSEDSVVLYDCRRAETFNPRVLIHVGVANANTLDYEKAVSVTGIENVPHQHIVLTTFHLLLIDQRMPGRCVLQWRHSLDNTLNNRLNLVTSHALKDQRNIISACNGDTVCLTSLKYNHEASEAFNFPQVHSIHSPWHAFCLKSYNISMESQIASQSKAVVLSSSTCSTSARTSPPSRAHLCEDICSDDRIVGLVSITSPSYGFTIVTSTQFGDIFMQDFVLNEQTEVEEGEEKQMKEKPVKRGIKKEAREEGESEEEEEEGEKSQDNLQGGHGNHMRIEYLEYSIRLEKERIAQKKCREKEKHSQTTHLMENHQKKQTQGEGEEKRKLKYDCKSKSKTHCTCSCCLRWKADDSIAQVTNIDPGGENLVTPVTVTSATLCTPSSSSSRVTLPIRSEYTEDSFFRKYSHLFDLATDSINSTFQPHTPLPPPPPPPPAPPAAASSSSPSHSCEKEEWNSLTYKLLRNWSLD